MNYCGVTVLLGLLCSFFMSSNAHPFSTFGMQILNVTADGVSNPPEIVSGKQYRIYFHFVDNLHNYAPVTMKNVIKYHQKYFHILVVSQDQEVTLHIHPDDQMDLENAPLDLSLFYLDITFPRGGTYSLAASFLFFDSILDRHREGFAQTELGPFTGDTGKPTYDYSTNGRYPTYAFDSNGNFDSWIDTKTNVDDNQGFYATFEIFGRNDSDVNAGLNYIHSNVCTWFKLTIHKNDSMNTPATMLPYLAASVHLTVALDDGGVYHAHGMYLQSEDQTFDQLVATQKGMTMARMMKLKTSDPMYNLSMNAAMIGITNTGGYNCSSDEGDVTDYMMDMMDMSMFYGPSSFGSVVGIFDFAAPGVSDWRIFAYMKVQLSNGEERLIVPHFSVRSFGANLPITPPDNSTDALSSESRSDAFTIAPVQIFIFALVCVISLF